jgi:hypothetical protein
MSFKYMQSLFKRYKKPLLDKLRYDETFLEGINGKPQHLPSAFIADEQTEYLINYYLNNTNIKYEDIQSANQTGGAVLTPEQVWEKYNVKLIPILLTDVDFRQPETGITELPADFLSPTKDLTYLEWVVKSYIFKGLTSIFEVPALYQALKDYSYLKLHKKLKEEDNDINAICGLIGCTIKFKFKRGLESVLSNYKEEIKERDVFRGKEPLFKCSNFKLYHPETKEEACYYGKMTTWCTAATKSENMFDYYNSQGNLYIIVPEHPERPNEKYQLSYARQEFMDETQKTRLTVQQLFRRFPELFVKFDETESLIILHMMFSPINNRTIYVVLSKDREKGEYLYVNDEFKTFNDTKTFNFIEMSVKFPDLFKLLEETSTVSVLEFKLGGFSLLLVPKKPRRPNERYVINYQVKDDEDNFVSLTKLATLFPDLVRTHKQFKELRVGTFKYYEPENDRDATDIIYIPTHQTWPDEAYISIRTDNVLQFANPPYDVYSVLSFTEFYPELLSKIYEDDKIEVYLFSAPLNPELQILVSKTDSKRYFIDFEFKYYIDDANIKRHFDNKYKINIYDLFLLYPSFVNIEYSGPDNSIITYRPRGDSHKAWEQDESVNGFMKEALKRISGESAVDQRRY